MKSGGPADDTDAEFDPTAPEHSGIGRTVFDENMGPGSAMAHLYRGEIHRMERWRERLDRTTHWAVIVIATILTFAFSNRSNPHYVIVLGMAVLTMFLVIEARRFRGYDIWRSRTRILQRNVFAYGLDPSQGVVEPAWRRELSRDYRRPTPEPSLEEAVAHRLRRVYLPLYVLLFVAWVIHTTSYSPQPWPASAEIAGISGTVVSGLLLAGLLLVLIIAYRPREWHVEGEID